MGIFLGTIARSMPQFGLLLMLVLLPLQMLSGGMTPRESMPEFVQYIMLAAPTTHFVMLAQAILYRGAGLRVVWPQFVVLLAIGSTLFSFRCAASGSSSNRPSGWPREVTRKESSSSFLRNALQPLQSWIGNHRETNHGGNGRIGGSGPRRERGSAAGPRGRRSLSDPVCRRTGRHCERDAEKFAPRIIGDVLDAHASHILSFAEKALSAGFFGGSVRAAPASAEIIIDEIRRENIDVVVVGRRESTGQLSGLLLGSVSQKLASLAPCMVTIVP